MQTLRSLKGEGVAPLDFMPTFLASKVLPNPPIFCLFELIYIKIYNNSYKVIVLYVFYEYILRTLFIGGNAVL